MTLGKLPNFSEPCYHISKIEMIQFTSEGCCGGKWYTVCEKYLPKHQGHNRYDYGCYQYLLRWRLFSLWRDSSWFTRFFYQVLFRHSAQFLRFGTLNLVKLSHLITAIHNNHILPLLYFSQVHVSGITDTEEERIKEAAAYIAQRNLLASEEGITTSKQSTVSKQSSSTLHQEEAFEKKSRKVAIREKAERLSLRKTVRKDNLI